MPKREDIKKILVIGSGPIIIGQAAEFDYAGTQCCLSLKEEGYEVVLVNSNPATIMTDKEVVDKIYMEPLSLKYVSKIVRKERPDAIIGAIGGQTGLNLVMQLDESGVLSECNVEVLGTNLKAIRGAEDREEFRDLCLEIGEPIIESEIANTKEEAIEIANKIGYPIILRPAYTLGGTGGGFVNTPDEIERLVDKALNMSPTHQVLVEKSIKGYKEIEYEVMRDKNDNVVIICNMENINAVGIHTGDSAVVAPSQTLTNEEYQMLRNSSINIIRSLGIEGGCNAQFALDPFSKSYYVIEVNPRVSRSSALASKATGYPIAYVSAKIAVGYTLEEIKLKNTPACFEPSLDYIVTKLARFPFDKFSSVNRKLSTQMKATGEVMAIGRTFEESYLKAIKSLENDFEYLDVKEIFSNEEILDEIAELKDNHLYLIAQALRQGVSQKSIHEASNIDYFFINKMNNIIELEKEIIEKTLEYDLMYKSKKMGMSDKIIARLKGVSEREVRETRKALNIIPVFKMIDSCGSEFDSYIPYFYSTYENQNESIVTEKESVILIGSGPIRIGQGVEFDYSTVHAIKTLKKNGYEAIVINSNPETVSTDYTVSDKLYFEPLDVESVLNIIEHEKPKGIIVGLGGQTPINLSNELLEYGVNVLGTSVDSISMCENRDLFEEKLEKLNILRPKGKAIYSLAQGLEVTKEISYPVLIRPSFVLGGRAMKIIYSDEGLKEYLQTAVKVNEKHPVLIDKYITGKEVEVDAVCDGEQIFIPGIMEHIEKTGVHSGDSISVFPTYSLNESIIEKIISITRKIGLEFKIKGLYNIQFIVDENDDIYIIEVNPRASRSVPFISKVTSHNLSTYATKVAIGKKLKDLNLIDGLNKDENTQYYVKVPTFSFNKIEGLDTYLSPEMKSTGEAIGYDITLNKALYKGLEASNLKVHDYGTVFITVSDDDKEIGYELAKRFWKLGFNITATENTANYLNSKNVPVQKLKKISSGSDEIVTWIQSGFIKYVINTGQKTSEKTDGDGYIIRTTAAVNNIPTFTSFDTVNVLLNVLEERSTSVSEI